MGDVLVGVHDATEPDQRVDLARVQRRRRLRERLPRVQREPGLTERRLQRTEEPAGRVLEDEDASHA